MKHQEKTRRNRLLALVAAVLALSIMLTGCLDELAYFLEDDEDIWEGENLWEETEDLGDHWWDHPGQGGTTAADEWDGDTDYGWWNALDDSWSLQDWEYLEDDLWMIYDEETECVYLYDEEYDQFGAMDVFTEEIFILDTETGEWIPAE